MTSSDWIDDVLFNKKRAHVLFCLHGGSAVVEYDGKGNKILHGAREHRLGGNYGLLSQDAAHAMAQKINSAHR